MKLRCTGRFWPTAWCVLRRSKPVGLPLRALHSGMIVALRRMLEHWQKAVAFLPEDGHDEQQVCPCALCEIRADTRLRSHAVGLHLLSLFAAVVPQEGAP